MYYHDQMYVYTLYCVQWYAGSNVTYLENEEIFLLYFIDIYKIRLNNVNVKYSFTIISLLKIHTTDCRP